MTFVPCMSPNPQLHRHPSSDVGVRLAARQAGAHHQIVDVARVGRGHLVQSRLHDLYSQVIRSHGPMSVTEPLPDRPIGDRTVATMTASAMSTPPEDRCAAFVERAHRFGVVTGRLDDSHLRRGKIETRRQIA